MSLLKPFTDADGVAVQPYFAAYMIERGFRTVAETLAADGGTWPYMAWNDARWREFERPRGYSNEMRAFHRAEFLAWLEARALDHLARNAVEAA